ncbi:MAG: four helix bundle protein [Myxococcales bacterium]|nr:four helix bundle protein [Myxococcales bacterium]
MTPSRKGPYAMPFVALDVALTLIHSLRAPVNRIRRHHAKHANQIVDAASSIAANLAEGNRRTGKDRLHLFRIAAGSADETRVHLLVAKGWGWVSEQEVTQALSLLDRELRLLHGLTR